MPISASSDAWNNADEILDTQWADAEEEQTVERVERDEFEENREEYEAGQEAAAVMLDQIQTARLRSRIGDLTREGLVEGRKVPTEHTNIPYDWKSVSYHTYTGDAK